MTTQRGRAALICGHWVLVWGVRASPTTAGGPEGLFFGELNTPDPSFTLVDCHDTDAGVRLGGLRAKEEGARVPDWRHSRSRGTTGECHQARPSIFLYSKTSPLALAGLLRVRGSASLDPRGSWPPTMTTAILQNGDTGGRTFRTTCCNCSEPPSLHLGHIGRVCSHIRISLQPLCSMKLSGLPVILLALLISSAGWCISRSVNSSSAA